MTKAFTDSMYFADASQKYTGLANNTAEFLQKVQLTDVALWKCFVQQFRDQIDGTNNGWRGEYWGKMIRGAVFVYEYSKDEELYNILTDTVKDMLTVAEDDGRVSSFSRDTEFNAWDIWCRKYVLLGMEYYLEICRDDSLRADIIKYLCGAADYIIAHIGEEEDKIDINKACDFWIGLNSSSILEPMVRLYSLTGDKKYFDFSKYIVKCGGTDSYNIFERAYENLIMPYQYGVSKAYEMMSCFEGLLEFYRITGIEKYKTAVINFGKAVIDSEVSVIGSCGCTHELFDHTKTRQTQFYNGIMQETCVTVTWMKLCSQLLRLTGESIFADQIEHSFYNAYLGTLNTENKDCSYITRKYAQVCGVDSPVYTYLPFDSYSPLIPGKRGEKTGGCQFFADKTYYGCCVAIGAAGVGVFLKSAVMRNDKGVVVNFYEKGSAELAVNGSCVKLDIDTCYPADGKIAIKVSTDKPVTFDLSLRVPAWSANTQVSTDKEYSVIDGYATLSGEWSGETTVVLELDMSIRTTSPITWDTDVLYINTVRKIKPPLVVKHLPEDDYYISLARGPLTLCADSKMGKDARSEFTFAEKDGVIDCKKCPDTDIYDGKSCTLKCEFTDENGESFTLIDYASAGRDWDTYIAAWLPIPKK